MLNILIQVLIIYLTGEARIEKYISIFFIQLQGFNYNGHFLLEGELKP